MASLSSVANVLNSSPGEAGQRRQRLTTRKSLVEVGGVLLQVLSWQVLFPVAEGKIQPGPCCRESLGAVTDLVAGKRNESALKRLIIEGISVGSACHWLFSSTFVWPIRS